MPEMASAPGGTAGTPGNLVAKPGVALGGMVAIASAAQLMSVLDSSAMPAVTRGNLHVPVIMLAKRATEVTFGGSTAVVRGQRAEGTADHDGLVFTTKWGEPLCPHDVIRSNHPIPSAVATRGTTRTLGPPAGRASSTRIKALMPWSGDHPAADRRDTLELPPVTRPGAGFERGPTSTRCSYQAIT